MKFLRFLIFILSITGCSLVRPQDVITPIIVVVPSVTPIPTETPPVISPSGSLLLPGKMQDVLPIMSGICFESAWDAAGQVFVFRSAEDHIRFYDLADHSELCRRPVTRYPFDFSDGSTLAGLWSRGSGCTAWHEVIAYERDDPAKTIQITVKFRTDGNCPYELVRPFWVRIPDSQEYEIHIELTE